MDRLFDFEAQRAEAEMWIKYILSGEDFRGEIIGRDDFETEDGFHFTIDTCLVKDLQVYETAICEKNMAWVVVDRDNSPSEARVNHMYWVQKVKNEDVRFFESVQDGCIYGVMKGD